MGSIETLKQQTGLANKEPITIEKLLLSLKPQVALALPRHLNVERMMRIALTCVRQNPRLAECTPQSLMASIMLASQLGLEPGVMGQAYLIPYKNRSSGKYICTFVPGWQGLLDLVNRAGKATAWTGAVYKGDEFEWCLGDKPHIVHRPCGDEELLTHVYAVARTKESDWPIIEVWPAPKVWKHRDKYNKVGQDHYSFQHPQMYARKVALLQTLKYVPRSIELVTAITLEETAETGLQNLEIGDVKGVLEGTSLPELTSGEPEQSSPKLENAMCSECRQINGHKPDCVHAQPACSECHAPAGKVHATKCSLKDAVAAPTPSQEPEKPAEGGSDTPAPSELKPGQEKMILRVLDVQPWSKGNFSKLNLRVEDNDMNEFEISCWHKSLFEELQTAKEQLCVFVVKKNSKGYYDVEQVLAIGAKEF